jgi:hypothetical protein
VPVILEDGSENLSALDSALQDRTAQDWVSPALTSSPIFQLPLPSEPYVICTSIVTVRNLYEKFIGRFCIILFAIGKVNLFRIRGLVQVDPL